MGSFTKEVERAAHVDLTAGEFVDQRQVERAAPGMSGMAGQVTLRHYLVFGNIGIEERFHGCIRQVLDPLHEVIDSHLRAVGIENLDTIALFAKLIGGLSKRLGRLACTESHWSLIAVNALTDEIISAKITHFENNIRHHISETYKPRRLVWL